MKQTFREDGQSRKANVRNDTIREISTVKHTQISGLNTYLVGSRTENASEHRKAKDKVQGRGGAGERKSRARYK